MDTQSHIETLIAGGKYDEAKALLDRVERPVAEYLRGRMAWKDGDRGAAISHYSVSAALDPDGPGAIALEQARSIMDYFNKDLMNP